MISFTVLPLNNAWPVKHVYRITPIEKMSTLLSYGLFANNSGAKYPGVPHFEHLFLIMYQLDVS